MGKNRNKVVFMGAKDVGLLCLKHLVENRDSLGIDLVTVLTSPKGKAIEEYCRGRGLKLTDTLEAFLDQDDCDLIVSVQYHRILKPEHIRKAKNLAINLHMAPLPEFRGCNQFSYAIIEGRKEFGTTIHVLDEGVDSGAIIAERRFPIPENAWVGELFEETSRQSVSLFRDEIKKIIAGEISPVSQEGLIAERGTSFHYRREIDELKLIDLDWPAEKINRHVRGTYMEGFEPPYALINGKKVFFVKEALKPGTGLS